MFKQNYQRALFCLSLVVPTVQTGLCAQPWEVLSEISGSHWHDVYFVDEQHGWLVGWTTSKILNTTNGGMTWEEQFRFPNHSQNPVAVQFVDANHGWVIGFPGDPAMDEVVFLTTDSGQRWNTPNAPPAGFLRDLSFVDAREGWVVGLLVKVGEDLGIGNFRPAIAYTADGGISWERQWQGDGLKGLTFADTVFFLNNQSGWVAGAGDVILSTEDGGRTWRQTPLGLARSASIWRLRFIDSLTGWAVGQYYGEDASLVLQTTDGGQTWRVQYEGKGDQTAWDVQFLTPQEGWVVGETYLDNHTRMTGGFLLHTTDGGGSWDRQESTAALLTVHFVTPERGVVAGPHNVLLQTTDLGATWLPRLQRGYRLTDVSFRPDGKGWILANSDQHPKFASGLTRILHSTDGGQTWTVISELPAAALQEFLPQHGVAVGWQIQQTTDGGSTWTMQRRPEPGFRNAPPDVGRENRPGGLLRAVDFATETQGVIVGEVGRIYLTRDGGATWEMLRKETDVDLFNVQFLDERVGFIAGGYAAEGQILHSNNGGRSWDILARLDSPVNALQMINDRLGWAVGGGYIWHTQDGGRKWEIQERVSGEHPGLHDVLFLDERRGWVVGDEGRIFATTDGGQSWQRQNSGTQVDLMHIAYNQRDALIVVGDWNTILRYQDDALRRYAPLSVTPENQRFTQWGVVKSHLYQNFPNPFNPETWIPYTLASAGEVELHIYEASGQLVRRLVQGNREAGFYLTAGQAIYWDGRNEAGEVVSSGAYFYHLQAGDFQQTRRMVMMK